MRVFEWPRVVLICSVWITQTGLSETVKVVNDERGLGRNNDVSHIDRVVRASEIGASLSSDLLKGGGADDTEALQKVLDRGADGKGIHLIVDGPALIRGLTLYSRTTVECTAGGGFYLKANSLRSVLRNANRSRDAVVDENIVIRGCFINGNRRGQPRGLGPEKSPFKYVQEPDGTFRNGLQFFGIHYLTIENVTLWNVHGFHSQIANAKYVNIRDVVVDTAIPGFPERGGVSEQRSWTREHWSNDDGLHFNGPIQYLSIDGARIRTWDDGISFTANDYGRRDLTLDNEMGPYVGQGPITDVNVSNVIFMDSHRGIRMLSEDQRIDRISINNVTGTNRERFAALSHHSTTSHGNFGSVTFSNVNVHCNPHPTWLELGVFSGEQASKSLVFLEENELPLFALNSPIENLQLYNILTRVVDSRPLIRVGPDARIGTLNVRLSIHDADKRAVPLKLMGEIQRLKVSLDWAGSTPIDNEGGKVDRLEWIGGGYPGVKSERTSTR